MIGAGISRAAAEVQPGLCQRLLPGSWPGGSARPPAPAGVGGFRATGAAELLRDAPINEGLPELPTATEGQEVVLRYGTIGLSLRGRHGERHRRLATGL